MAWSEWQNISKYGKCIWSSSGFKTTNGTNNHVFAQILTDNEYLESKNIDTITVLKSFKARLVLITRTASDSAANTYSTVYKNGTSNPIISTNDGQKSVGKIAFAEASFEEGDIITGIQYANGTPTVQAFLMFI